MLRCVMMWAAAAFAWSSSECLAAPILASNTTAVSPSLRAFTEVEVGLFYTSTNTQVATQATAMRFWFPSGLTGLKKASIRDGQGNNAGSITGSLVRTDGAFEVYEFGFGGSSLNPRSDYYAGYDFLNSGTAVNIGTSTADTISFDSALLSSVQYSSVNPDPTDPQSPTFGQYPRFELVGVPEPGAGGLAVVALAGLLGARGLRMRWSDWQFADSRSCCEAPPAAGAPAA